MISALGDSGHRALGEAFQAFVDHRFPIAVVPREHPFGTREAGLAREHAAHNPIRFRTSQGGGVVLALRSGSGA